MDASAEAASAALSIAGRHRSALGCLWASVRQPRRGARAHASPRRQGSPRNTNAPPVAGTSASSRRFPTSTYARASPCSFFSSPSRRIAWPPLRLPSSSAGDDPASELPRPLSAGRGLR